MGKGAPRKQNEGSKISTLPTAINEFIFDPPLAPTLWPRKLFHLIAGSSIPLAVLCLPTELIEWMLIVASIAVVLLEAGRGLLPRVNDFALRWLPFFKPSERFAVTGSTFLVLGATAAMFAFDKEIVVLALLFLAVGDPLAAIVGSRDHRLRIFGKSVAGTAAFVGGAVAAGFLIGLHPDIPRAWWLVPGAFTAAIVELAPLPFDDNLSVPLAAAGVMTLLALL
jgi:dolichol kinase